MGSLGLYLNKDHKLAANMPVLSKIWASNDAQRPWDQGRQGKSPSCQGSHFRPLLTIFVELVIKGRNWP